ncbi:MAG: oligoribonuclease [Dehalococcoidia bacterium]|nr:oligoribonuclease [Dehalococcoidia bacterium]|tara:strand:- start:2376 stop:2948 length:573 start_codon:yes stop_codon:yes gene_type:complete
MNLKTEHQSNNLVWIDLEMTGLDPKQHVIVEIATIVTDSSLNILAEGPVIAINRTHAELKKIETWSLKTHTTSGLLSRVAESEVGVEEAEAETLKFLNKWVPEGASPLCGNSVHQDRRFLRLEMPKLDSYFHYRIIDVSTIKEIAKRWYDKEVRFPAKPKKHLALDDIRESIKELEWYREKIFANVAGDR